MHGSSIAANVQILPMVRISMHYCSTTGTKLNSSANAQLWNVCPTIGNILLAAVNFQKMAKDASFQMLIDMCEKVGWEEGISQLEKIVLQNENMQASLFAGTSSQIKQAQKLSKTIIQQNISIGRLKQYRLERGYISEGGYLMQNGKIYEVREEKDLFDRIGVEYVEPKHRSL